MNEIEQIKKLADEFFSKADEFVKKHKIELEDQNFRVDSDGWTKKTDGNIEYFENPQGDIWEIINHPTLSGEQLFTWESAIRETNKAGKRMPTDEEWGKLEIPMIYAGYRSTAGSFYNLTSYACFWSSSESSATYAWRRALYSGDSTVYRHASNKGCGFSVRCFK